MKRNHTRQAVALGLALIWLVVAGCGESRAPYAGTYRSMEPFAGKGHIDLVLKENGECTWTFEGNTFKFKWRVQDDRIWLYTKEGGILIITPSEDGQRLSADMTGDWHPGCPPHQCITFIKIKAGG